MSDYDEGNRTGGVGSVDLGRRRRRWLLFSIGGLILIGAGVSIVGQAIILKAGESAFWSWFMLGTAGLVVLNSGVSCVGQGVIEKVKLDGRIE